MDKKKLDYKEVAEQSVKVSAEATPNVVRTLADVSMKFKDFGEVAVLSGLVASALTCTASFGAVFLSMFPGVTKESLVNQFREELDRRVENLSEISIPKAGINSFVPWQKTVVKA